MSFSQGKGKWLAIVMNLDPLGSAGYDMINLSERISPVLSQTAGCGFCGFRNRHGLPNIRRKRGGTMLISTYRTVSGVISRRVRKFPKFGEA